MSTKSILFIVNRASAEVEWIFPVLCWLSGKGYNVEIVFLRKKEIDYCFDSPTIKAKMIANKIKCFCLEDRFGMTLFSQVLFLLYKPVFILSRIEKLQNFLIYFKLKLFMKLCHIPVNPDVLFLDNSFYIDLTRQYKIHHNFVELLNPKQVLLHPHSPIYDEIPENPDVLTDSKKLGAQDKNTFFWLNYPSFASKTTFISDSIPMLKLYYKTRGMQVKYVGCPRFQRWWVDRPEQVVLNSNTVLILSNLTARFYEELPVDQLLTEVIQSCQMYGLNWLVKPHPRDDMDMLKRVIESVTDDSFESMLFHESVFDFKERFGLSIGLPSSALWDTVANGIYSIEYYDFRVATKPSTFINGIPKPRNADFPMTKLCNDKTELSDFLSDYVDDQLDMTLLISKQKRALFDAFDSEMHAGEIVETIIPN